jgi:hypothetical protein
MTIVDEAEIATTAVTAAETSASAQFKVGIVTCSRCRKTSEGARFC